MWWCNYFISLFYWFIILSVTKLSCSKNTLIWGLNCLIFLLINFHCFQISKSYSNQTSKTFLDKTYLIPGRISLCICMFENLTYAIGLQAPFHLQTKQCLCSTTLICIQSNSTSNIYDANMRTHNAPTILYYWICATVIIEFYSPGI